jgi:hypothetical protein
VGRRLFNDLEQRVEALRRDHVGLIQDENLESVAGRGEDGALTKVTGIINTVVARSVNFDDVQ